jgi:hypothetical protein
MGIFRNSTRPLLFLPYLLLFEHVFISGVFSLILILSGFLRLERMEMDIDFGCNLVLCPRVLLIVMSSVRL